MPRSAGFILNIVLAVAVVVLYILHFTQRPGKTASPATYHRSFDSLPGSNAFRIAYFDIDSITNNYQYCIDVRTELEKLKDAADVKVEQRQKAFDEAYNQLQTKAAAAKITPDEIEREKNALSILQQAINDERDKGASDYEQQRKLFELEIKNSIAQFLREFNTPQKFSFILADEPGIFYYRDSLYNITTEVIDGLNLRYRKKNN